MLNGVCFKELTITLLRKVFLYKGVAEISQNYFQSLPGIHECPADQNPASYMLEIIGAGIGHVAQRDFALDYQQSSLAQRNRM
jgi:hypothetical protein